MSELEIDLSKVFQKFLVVLTQRGMQENNIAAYDDMAGPVLVLIVFALSFLLRGRVEFGNIYGFGLSGCCGIYFIMNLMAHKGQYVELYTCLSVLGYALTPFVVLAYLSIFIAMNNAVGYAVCALFVLWSTVTAARLFEYSLDMEDKKYLIAYPIVLFYAIFL